MTLGSMDVLKISLPVFKHRISFYWFVSYLFIYFLSSVAWGFKNPHDIFHRNRKNNPKIHAEPQRPQIAKAILRKKNKAEDITLLDYKISYKATVIKTVWNWRKYRHAAPWNKIESPNISLHIYSQLFSDRVAKNTQWKRTVFNKWCRETEYLYAKERN